MPRAFFKTIKPSILFGLMRIAKSNKKKNYLTLKRVKNMNMKKEIKKSK